MELNLDEDYSNDDILYYQKKRGIELSDDMLLGPPVMLRSINDNNYKEGIEILEWLRHQNLKINNENSCDLRVFPVKYFDGSTIHWVSIENNGYSEELDISNQEHLYLLELLKWWNEEGIKIYYNKVIKKID